METRGKISARQFSLDFLFIYFCFAFGAATFFHHNVVHVSKCVQWEVEANLRKCKKNKKQKKQIKKIQVSNSVSDDGGGNMCCTLCSTNSHKGLLSCDWRAGSFPAFSYFIQWICCTCTTCSSFWGGSGGLHRPNPPLYFYQKWVCMWARRCCCCSD